MTRTESKIRKANKMSEAVIIMNTREVEIINNGDWEATDKLAEAIMDILGWGGFKCGHGGWVLRKDYSIPTYDDHFGCPTSELCNV